VRLLIVGAGVAGLALARALLQRGITAEVVERTSEWEPLGAGLYLPGNAVRALRELGIGSGLDAHANAIGTQRIFDHSGRLLADIEVDRVWDGVGACVAIHRAALHEALREAAADVPVRLGVSVTGLKDGETRDPSSTAASGRPQAVGIDAPSICCTPAVVTASPPMVHWPLVTSWITTHVAGRTGSPTTSAKTCVIPSAMDCFRFGDRTFSITFTSTIGMELSSSVVFGWFGRSTEEFAPS
jgi:FAD binding domain